MKSIKVLGNTYKSIAAAWRELSPETLKQITVRLRLRNGWHVDDAFTIPTVPARSRRTHRRYRNG
jgi:hypothetical protein